MKEKLIPNTPISIEQTIATLGERIKRSGKSVIAVSDIDGTLASTHTFDHELQLHTPHLRDELIAVCRILASRSSIDLHPLLIATGRPDSDPSVIRTWQLLSAPPMPIIGENGGTIIFPQFNDGQSPASHKIVHTARNDELIKLLEISTDLPILVNLLHQNSIVPIDHEILVDHSRKTSLEIRIQNKITKVGSSLIHGASSLFLREKIGNSKLSVISSGSSVSIHPATISKGNAVLQVIDNLGIDRNKLFIVGIGDADNDESLFQIADLGIGVEEATIGKSEITCLGGEDTTIAVIKAIGEIII
jgi:HAD superfamily hydrolase (TIGR01484 family)